MPLQDPNGAILTWFGTCTDIDDLKRAEADLQRSEERYRTLITATTAIVWNSPASGAFDTEQPAWTAFTGQTVGQHRGWGWLDVIHPDDREKSGRAWAAAVAAKGQYQVEHRVRRADGVYRHMTVRAVPILDPDGAPPSARRWMWCDRLRTPRGLCWLPSLIPMPATARVIPGDCNRSRGTC